MACNRFASSLACLLIAITSFTSIARADEPKADDPLQAAISRESTRKEIIGELAKLKTRSDYMANLERVERALAETLDDSSVTDADTMRKSVKTKILQKLTAIDASDDRVEWLTAAANLTNRLFTKASAGDAKATTLAGTREILSWAAEVIREERGKVELPGALPAGSELPADLVEQVLETLRAKETNAFQLDPRFPQTCKALADAIRQRILPQIDDLDVAQIQAALKSNVERVINDVEGKLARDAWLQAHRNFLARFQASKRFDVNSKDDWKKVLRIMAEGLDRSIKADEAALAKFLEQRGLATAGGNIGGGDGSGSGGVGASHAAVRHARIMSRIEMRHDRNMYRIRSLHGGN